MIMQLSWLRAASAQTNPGSTAPDFVPPSQAQIPRPITHGPSLLAALYVMEPAHHISWSYCSPASSSMHAITPGRPTRCNTLSTTSLKAYGDRTRRLYASKPTKVRLQMWASVQQEEAGGKAVQRQSALEQASWRDLDTAAGSPLHSGLAPVHKALLSAHPECLCTSTPRVTRWCEKPDRDQVTWTVTHRWLPVSGIRQRGLGARTRSVHVDATQLDC